ncbi:MAG: hypothetical protein SFW67_05060 [Myxococcaceae bacterium]|nr:hypothetical protein [Myxococcaceae bacterium]
MLALALLVVLAQAESTLKPSMPGPVFNPSSLPTNPVGASRNSTFTPTTLNSGTTLPGGSTNPLVKKVSIVEGRGQPCEMLATMSVCDDLTVIEPVVVKEPLVLSEDTPPLVPHLRFVGLKAGRTTCACGVSRETAQLVYDITVVGLDEAMLPAARKVVVDAFERRYTRRAVQVP